MLTEEKNANDINLESKSLPPSLFPDINIDNYHCLYSSLCMLISALIFWRGEAGLFGFFVFCFF